MNTIDLNSDMGELPQLLADGTQDKIMAHISSINISCGAHAGDDATIAATLAAAKSQSLAVGAHPGYPDRANFGRTTMPLDNAALSDSIFTQLRHLADLAGAAGIELTHIKPHGALYHEVSRGHDVADAFFDALSRFSRDLVFVGFAGSAGLQAAAARGFHTAAEAFIDRAYEPDGTLRARTLPGALLPTPGLALAQALDIVQHRHVKTTTGTIIPLSARTLCIHSDTPGSAALAASVAAGLRAAGICILPFGPH